jgi:hypothetical protein
MGQSGTFGLGRSDMLDLTDRQRIPTKNGEPEGKRASKAIDDSMNENHPPPPLQGGVERVGIPSRCCYYLHPGQNTLLFIPVPFFLYLHRP